jgi:hypothetical protein
MADFTGKKIKDTYARVVQYHNGTLKDGLGFAISASAGSLSGSLSGSFEGNFNGSFTGSFNGPIVGATSSSLATRITTNASNITTLQSFSSSLDATYATDAQVSTAVSSLNNSTSSYATTGSNIFKDNQFITGSNVVLMVGDNHWDTGSATIYAKESEIDLWLEQDSNNTDGPQITFFKARGGTSGEAPAIAGDEILNISGKVYKSSSTAQGNDVTLNDWITLSQIQSKVLTAESASYGSEMTFSTVKSGSTDLQTIIKLDQTGTINLQEKTVANDQLIASDRFIASGSINFSGSFDSKFGHTELGQNSTRMFLLAIATGSGNGNALLNVRRETSGSTTAIIHANEVQIAKTRGTVSIGNTASATNITGSSLGIKANTTISSSQLLTIQPSHPLPSSPDTGSFAVTGSILAFYNGNNWLEISGSILV